MYSEEVRKIKIKADLKKPAEVREAEAVLKEFCTRDDIIGCPQKDFLALFRKHCKEQNLPDFNNAVLGKAIRSVFKVDRKCVRYNGNVVWVYIAK